MCNFYAFFRQKIILLHVCIVLKTGVIIMIYRHLSLFYEFFGMIAKGDCKIEKEIAKKIKKNPPILKK